MSRAEYRQSLNGTIARTLTCPQCGCDLSNHPSAQESQQRIQELEAQVRLLNEKATAAGTVFTTSLLRLLNRPPLVWQVYIVHLLTYNALFNSR